MTMKMCILKIIFRKNFESNRKAIFAFSPLLNIIHYTNIVFISSYTIYYVFFYYIKLKKKLNDMIHDCYVEKYKYT